MIERKRNEPKLTMDDDDENLNQLRRAVENVARQDIDVSVGYANDPQDVDDAESWFTSIPQTSDKRRQFRGSANINADI